MATQSEITDISTIFSKTIEIIKGYYAHSEQYPVLKYISPAETASRIDLSIKQDGVDLDTFFGELKKIVEISPKTSSKGFFNLLVGGKIIPVVAAEMIATALNNTMHTYKSAGVHILIENEVIGYMLKKIGFPDGDGIFAPGGSISNMVAMIVARNEKHENILKEGLYGLPRMTMYVSDQGHYSIYKNANLIGVGESNVRIVKSDDQGKMDMCDLERLIVADIAAGYTPFFIKNTAGTTVLGAFDPIDETAKIAQKYNIWLHVDAALGGTFLMSQKYKHLLQGIEGADSVARNPHKMMNIPLLASAILIKKKGLLEKHFYEGADYLYQMTDNKSNFDLNPGGKSIQCGRRNDALKVWAGLKLFGEAGYEKRIENQVSNAQHAVEIIKNDPALRLILPPEGINVCFQVVGSDAASLCDYADKQGIVKVSHGQRHGETFIRMMCVDADMTHDDIDAFFANIKKAHLAQIAA